DFNSASDVFVRQVPLGVTELVTKTASPSNSAGGESSITDYVTDFRNSTISDGGAVSADGRYVAFVSRAANLIPGMENPQHFNNVYRLDRRTGEVALVSVN